jgi:WD40 repeat protein
MVMALAIAYLEDDLLVVAGYENGHTCIWHEHPSGPNWTSVYLSKAHNQPVLSLDIAKTHGLYYTSAADAVVASHPLILEKTATGRNKQIQTKHSGQQALTVRSDEKIFATAGWDGRIRVYSAKTLRELAVLKWHKEGCYALAFADLNPSVEEREQTVSKVPDTQIATIPYLTVEDKRNIKVQTTHWLAAGAKDGKVSLWDIY